MIQTFFENLPRTFLRFVPEKRDKPDNSFDFPNSPNSVIKTPINHRLDPILGGLKTESSGHEKVGL